MPRKCEPSWEVKKIIWDIAVSVGKANTEAISRQLDYQLDKLRNVDIFEDTPGHRAIRRIVNKDINALPPEVVIAKLPPHVWLLRNDYESIKKLANTMRAEEAPKQKPYEETPHKQRLRELATRLGNEIGLPVVFESFIVDLKPGNVLHLGSLTIRVSDKGKLKVGLSIETETSITHLYHGLLSHLKTGGFEAVLVDILNWKQGAAEDLKRCSKLITLAQKEIERTYDIKIAMNCQGQRGFTLYFPKTICAAAIEQARGSNYIGNEWYKTEGLDLRFGAYLICSSTSNEGLESYKAKHIELRKKYSTLELTKRIAEKRKDLNEIMLNIRPQLQKFIDMEHLPGQCDLCSSDS